MDRRELRETVAQKNFILAGKAIITVENVETGNRFTYKISAHKEKTLHFVSLLTGPDNLRDYSYMGTIFDAGEFRWTRSSRVGKDAMSFKAFDYVWRKLLNGGLPKQIKIWHEGRCCKCGRVLTVPESIERGIGPECAQNVNQ